MRSGGVVVDPFGLFCIAGSVGALAWTFSRPRPDTIAAEMVAAALEGAADPFAAAGRLQHPADRGEALFLAHRKLAFEERPREAREALGRAADVCPERYAESWLSEAVEPEDVAAALAACLALLKREPARDGLRAMVAQHLADADRADEALALLDRGGLGAPELRYARGCIVAETGDRREALRLLDDLARDLALSTDPGLANLGNRAASYADGIRAELLGAESVILAAARQGRLDPNAAVNFRLLGESLMAASGRIATRLDLAPLAEDEERARRLVAAGDPRGAVLDGVCLLRAGRTELARERFARAREAEPGSFPAALGLGAAMAQARGRAWAAVERLDAPPMPEGAAAFVPDLPALTREEQRVVAVSLHPLRAALPLLVARGVTIRVLPIDVRPTDLPALAAFEHERTDDARAVRAIGGLATHSIGVSRIEDLLDTVTEHAWVFAHEAAHLALFHLPDAWRARVEALRARAVATPWAATEYAKSNADEMFAVAYADWLNYVHDRPYAQPRDDEGVTDAVRALFTDLAGRDRL